MKNFAYTIRVHHSDFIKIKLYGIFNVIYSLISNKYESYT